MVDDEIGWIFTDVAHLDLEEHIPVIASFWETILLGAQTYGGGAFGVHLELHRKAGGLRKEHFERWLVLWCPTVDELFDGPRPSRRQRLPRAPTGGARESLGPDRGRA